MFGTSLIYKGFRVLAIFRDLALSKQRWSVLDMSMVSVKLVFTGQRPTRHTVGKFSGNNT